MQITREQLCQMLPHGDPMCLLSGVSGWDKTEITCVATSHRDPSNPLRQENGLSPVHLIEYSAQAVAVHIGLICDKERGGDIGYLVAVKDVRIYRDEIDVAGNELCIKARCMAVSGAGALYSTEIWGREAMILSAGILVKQETSGLAR